MSRPTKPGFYWLDHQHYGNTPVRVYESVHGLCAAFHGTTYFEEVAKIPESCWRGEIIRKKNKPNARVRAQRRKSAEEKTE